MGEKMIDFLSIKRSDQVTEALGVAPVSGEELVDHTMEVICSIMDKMASMVAKGHKSKVDESLPHVKELIKALLTRIKGDGLNDKITNLINDVKELKDKLNDNTGSGGIGVDGGRSGGTKKLDAFLAENQPVLNEATSINLPHHHHSKLFHGSHLLAGSNSHFQKILNSWYGVPKQTWRLIFRAHNHGFSAESFHNHCDGFSPTFILILGHNGDLCGGFTDVPWATPDDPKGRYVTSEKSFLFSLINRESTTDAEPTKFDVIKKRFAVVHHKKYGPIFGGGADLAISDNCNSNMDSYSNLPHSYEHANNYVRIMGDYYFCVKDYEVFTLAVK